MMPYSTTVDAKTAEFVSGFSQTNDGIASNMWFRPFVEMFIFPILFPFCQIAYMIISFSAILPINAYQFIRFFALFYKYNILHWQSAYSNYENDMFLAVTDKNFQTGVKENTIRIGISHSTLYNLEWTPWFFIILECFIFKFKKEHNVAVLDNNRQQAQILCDKMCLASSIRYIYLESIFYVAMFTFVNEFYVHNFDNNFNIVSFTAAIFYLLYLIKLIVQPVTTLYQCRNPNIYPLLQY